MSKQLNYLDKFILTSKHASLLQDYLDKVRIDVQATNRNLDAAECYYDVNEEKMSTTNVNRILSALCY